MKLNQDVVRQGDVCFRRVEERPSWAKFSATRLGGKLVIELGESSGHGHRITEDSVMGFRSTSPETAAFVGLDYIEVGGSGAKLRHEYNDGKPAEHETISLRPGLWLRAVQVSEEAEELKRMVD